MGVFTFVCRSSGAEWSAKQLTGDLQGSADSTFSLERKLVQSVLAVDSSGGVQSSFSYVSPSSAVFQVIIGGGGGSVGGGAAPAAAAQDTKAAEAPAAEEKKEVKEESEDEDMGFSLFD